MLSICAVLSLRSFYDLAAYLKIPNKGKKRIATFSPYLILKSIA